MKYFWEKQDVILGRQVEAHNRSERFVIAYDPAKAKPDKYGLVSLADGMLVGMKYTLAGLADYMTESGMRPVDLRPNDHVEVEDANVV